jgi:ribokinase
MSKHAVIVPGGLNTDIIGLGVSRILSASELTLGGELKIGPGGKARNMAQMAAAYLGKGTVAMIGRSSRDPFGFWKLPIQSLKAAGVDTSAIKIFDFKEAGNKFPGIALIPVDINGRNQIYVLPGVNNDFCQQDLDDAAVLFKNLTGNKIMLLALEIPLSTALYTIKKAAENNIRVVLDPGGINQPINEFLNDQIFILKPNEYEAQIITGVVIKDFASAQKAAQQMLRKGVKNVLITHGKKGGYLFNREIQLHIPIPPMKDSGVHDETGCGDQVTALIAAGLAENMDLITAARLAILGGTMQFYRNGIQPVERIQLEHEWLKLKR